MHRARSCRSTWWLERVLFRCPCVQFAPFTGSLSVCGGVCVCVCVLFAGVCVSLRVQECALFVNASGVCVCMCVVYGFVCVCVHP